MIKNTIVRSSILLFVIIMILFFVVQFFFRTQEYVQYSQYQYLLATSICNAFVITTITAIIAAYNMLQFSKDKSVGFFKIFGLGFSPGVIAGVLSLVCIFAIFYYNDPQGIEQIKTEYLDYSLVQAKEEGNYEEVAKVVNTPEVRNTNLLNIRTFTLISGALIFFNFSLGLMLAFLWKIRTTPKQTR